MNGIVAGFIIVRVLGIVHGISDMIDREDLKLGRLVLHINELIVHPFDFSNEEELAQYICLLKAIALRLDQHTVQFFIGTQISPSRGPAAAASFVPPTPAAGAESVAPPSMPSGVSVTSSHRSLPPALTCRRSVTGAPCTRARSAMPASAETTLRAAWLMKASDSFESLSHTGNGTAGT